MKRVFDVLVAVTALILATPIFLSLALWIKLDSPGPIFYRGLRIARGGGSFRIIKFRSMIVHQDGAGPLSTAGSDPRITRSGHLIRRLKFDELAQLINVALGDMSLVGPRPEVLKYLPLYTGRFAPILEVRPGITDWASIWNRDEAAILAGHDDPDDAYERLIQPTKLELQLRYVQQRSFWVDLGILGSTIRALLRVDYYPKALSDVARLQPARTG